ncbi:hypothetical protein X759_03145 [Mesorhizobium sp. LSHC420B00]|nr:hypothetical protein X759_03145 [Mesorhizobium sp. LSHC420B00]
MPDPAAAKSLQSARTDLLLRDKCRVAAEHIRGRGVTEFS